MDMFGNTNKRSELIGRKKGLSNPEKELPSPPQSPPAYHNSFREGTNGKFHPKSTRRLFTDHTGLSQAWRPLSYSLPVLSLWVLVSLLLIIGLQLLSWKSKKDGGILFALTVKDFTISQRFIYLYLPVLVFVAHGLCWTWIDQNAKRLEPFHSLAETKRAAAHVSVNLDYNSTFMFMVPIKAAKFRCVSQGFGED